MPFSTLAERNDCQNPVNDHNSGLDDRFGD